jgi:Domain of unknown function (DUF4349)
MNQGRTSWIAILGILLALLLVGSISIPNLLRSRMALRKAAPQFAGFFSPAQRGEQNDVQDALSERKLVRTAELSIQVKDLQSARQQSSALTSAMGGYIEQSEIYGESENVSSANLKLRVPASRLDETIERLKKSSLRVDHEKVESRDVTREYIDIDARLRNFQAEEQQYLAILKRASTVKDTLDVTQHLNDVRAQIDQLHAQLKYLSHQVEMASISLNLHMNAATLSAIHWTPSLTARNAFHDMLEGLTNWADLLLGLLIELPLILLWVVTIGAAALIIWKPSRFLWRRFRKNRGLPQPALGD